MTRRADLLLDERRIEGVYPIQRHLSPPLDIVAVEDGSHGALERAIGRLCQLWGGAKYMLVPATADGTPDPGFRTGIRWNAVVPPRSAHRRPSSSSMKNGRTTGIGALRMFLAGNCLGQRRGLAGHSAPTQAPTHIGRFRF